MSASRRCEYSHAAGWRCGHGGTAAGDIAKTKELAVAAAADLAVIAVGRRN
jgi:hypothetical protein